MTQDEDAPLAGIEADEYDALCAVEDLSEEKRRFVMAYMRTRDPLRAFKASGFAQTGNDRTDGRAARFQVMRDPEIQAAIAALQAGRLRKLAVNRNTIEGELAKIAFANIADFASVQEDGTAYLDFGHATREDFAGITELTCEIEFKPGDSPDEPRQVLKQRIKLGNKLGALEQLAKIHKLIGGDGAIDAVFDLAEAIRDGRRRAGLPER